MEEDQQEHKERQDQQVQKDQLELKGLLVVEETKELKEPKVRQDQRGPLVIVILFIGVTVFFKFVVVITQLQYICRVVMLIFMPQNTSTPLTVRHQVVIGMDMPHTLHFFVVRIQRLVIVVEKVVVFLFVFTRMKD